MFSLNFAPCWEDKKPRKGYFISNPFRLTSSHKNYFAPHAPLHVAKPVGFPCPL